jgi:hypothetical protein
MRSAYKVFGGKSEWNSLFKNLLLEGRMKLK